MLNQAVFLQASSSTTPLLQYVAQLVADHWVALLVTLLVVLVGGALLIYWLRHNATAVAIGKEFQALLLRHGAVLCVVLALLLLFAGVGVKEYLWWKMATEQMVQPLRQMEEQLHLQVSSSPLLAAGVRTDFNRLWTLMSQGREHHYQILVVSTSYQYSLLRTTQLATFVAGVAAVLLLPKGWGDASPILRAVFLTGAAAAAYCTVSTRLLQHDANITSNLQQYQAYALLQMDCARYAVTGPVPDPPKEPTTTAATAVVTRDAASPPMTPEQADRRYLQSLYLRLARIPALTFGLDPKQIGSPVDLAKQLGAGVVQ